MSGEDDATERLQVSTRQVDTAVVASPRGAIDMSSVHRLRAGLAQVLEPGPTVLVIDLAETDFLDSSGIGVLVATARQAHGAGCEFRIAAPRPSVARVFAVTALDRIWPIYPTVAEALAEPAG